MLYLVLIELKIVLKKVDFLRAMNALNANIKRLIKMENLMVDKDIFVKDVDVLLTSSLYHHSQVLN